MIAGCLVGIVGYAMLLGASTSSVRYGGTFLVACGVFQGSPMVGYASHRSEFGTDSGRSWAGCPTILLLTLSVQRRRVSR